MDITRSTLGRISDNDPNKRDIPSFIEPRPPLILNPFMRPRPVKKTNLLELFEEEDSELEDLEFVQVYLRLKPCEEPSNLYEVQSDKCLITSLDTATVGHGRRTQHNVSKMYTFSHIFGPKTSQKDIFEHVVKDNLRKLVDGQSYTLLTYGASGSGKTYTLMGTVTSPGLVPRSLEYVFKVVDAAQEPIYKPSDSGADKLNYAEQDYEMQWVKRLRQVSAPLRNKYRRMSAQLSADLTTSTVDLTSRTRYYVWVSFVEIYNEAVYDLLVNSDRRSASKLRIREDPSGHVYVKGATQAFVRTGAEAYDVLVAGKHNLQVAATGIHARSSRSHCIFTITLLAHSDEGVRISTVRLCDLAGAERAVKTHNVGARMKESRAINASLHVLERCLHALRRKKKQQGLVPYRESKLTRLLGAGLSGARGEAVSMVVTVNPAPELAAETRHVLQLAAVARDIQVNSTISESSLEFSQDSTASGADLMRLRADNERLHFEMAQLQSQYRELLSTSEERQQRSADTMREIADEAKDMTRQYYEAQIAALREKHRYELEDLREEYESRLRADSAAPAAPRSEHKLIAQLTREIAILEEKLNVERMALARANEENDHLRACIEERDEKLSEENASTKAAEDVMLVDSDQSDDELNESLEPSFRKDNLNTTRESSQSRDIDSDDDSMLEPTPKNSIQNNTSSAHKDSVNDKESDDSDSTIEPRESVDTNSIVEQESIDTNSYNTAKESMYDRKELSCDISSFDASVGGKMGSFEKKVEKEIFPDRGTYVVDVNDSSSPVVNETQDLAVIRESIDVDNERTINLEKQIRKSDNGYANSKLSNSFKETKAADESSFEAPNSRNMENRVKQAENEIFISRGTYYIGANESDLPQVNETKDFAETRSIIEDGDGSESHNKSNKSVSENTQNKREGSRSDSLLLFEQCEMDIKQEMVQDNRPKSSDSKLDTIPEIRIQGPDNSFEITEVRGDVTAKKHFYEFEKPDESSKAIAEKEQEKKKRDEDYRSPSIVKDDVPNNYNPTTINKLLGKTAQNNDSVDVFDDVNIGVDTCDVVDLQKSAKRMSLVEKDEMQNKKEKDLETCKDTVKNTNNIERFDISREGKTSEVNRTDNEQDKNDNTVENFENIFKNMSSTRATEFDLLVTDDSNVADQSKTRDEPKKVRYNLRQAEDEAVKYNLRHKADNDAERPSKSEHKPKMSLRLRRRKNETTEEEKNEDKKLNKLKNIENLRKEFSDVTLGLPAPVKSGKDIPSPEKTDGENCPPNFETMSCPSKRIPSPILNDLPSDMIITRSRRKLFTPRAEPLEESLANTGDSTERVRVPRPSYHRQRARARRKL